MRYEWENTIHYESKSNNELNINPPETKLDSALNVDAKGYKPKRTTAAIAKLQIIDMQQTYVHIEPYVE